MDISFRTKRLKKDFESESILRRRYGAPMAQTIMARVGVLKNALTLSKVPTMPPTRMHQLKGNRDEQFAVDLVHPYRLVFEPNHDPLPRKVDGGINLEQVTAIKIMEVVDYH